LRIRSVRLKSFLMHTHIMHTHTHTHTHLLDLVLPKVETLQVGPVAPAVCKV